MLYCSLNSFTCPFKVKHIIWHKYFGVDIVSIHIKKQLGITLISDAVIDLFEAFTQTEKHCT